MSIHEIRVNTWNELQDAIFAGAWQPKIGRYRARAVYRGTPDAAQPLVTGLMQLGGDYAGMEQHLMRAFRKYARQNVLEQDSDWNWLSLGQHHGLPTRLLDWSLSPLVAAHFATDDTHLFDLDGAVWVVNLPEAHGRLPQKLQDALGREGADLFTVEMLAEEVGSLADLDALAPPHFAAFFEPPSLDARIVNQYALFSVMSGPRLRLDEWLAEHPGAGSKIIIPAGLKWELRDKLDQANITERVLFPGLDGLSRWLRRYYTPRK